MLKVTGVTHSDGATRVEDPYIPLQVEWMVRVQPPMCYAYIRGAQGGYVELKFSSDGFTLSEMIVIDAPPECSCDRFPPQGIPVHANASPRVSSDLWEWKVTPDYREIKKNSIDLFSDSLCMKKSPTGVLLNLSCDVSPVKLISSGEAAVGVSEAGDLCSVLICS